MTLAARGAGEDQPRAARRTDPARTDTTRCSRGWCRSISRTPHGRARGRPRASSCDDPAVPAGEENLVVRAARAARRASRRRAARAHPSREAHSDGRRARRRKRRRRRGAPSCWPSSGGSRRRTRAELADARGPLGSDVPFFLIGRRGGSAGRGESRDARWTTRRRPSCCCSFRRFRCRRGASTGHMPDAAALPGTARRRDARSARFLGPNDLASAVLAMEPRMEAYLESAAARRRRARRSAAPARRSCSGRRSGGRERSRHVIPRRASSRARTLSRDDYRRLGPTPRRTP